MKLRQHAVVTSFLCRIEIMLTLSTIIQLFKTTVIPQVAGAPYAQKKR